MNSHVECNVPGCFYVHFLNPDHLVILSVVVVVMVVVLVVVALAGLVLAVVLVAVGVSFDVGDP